MLLYKETPTEFRDFLLYSYCEEEIEISGKEIAYIFEEMYDKKIQRDIIEVSVQFDKNCRGDIRFFDASIEEAEKKFPNCKLIGIVYNGDRSIYINYENCEMWIS